MDPKTHRPAWKTLLAFAIIYFVWGSTFLAIRIGVHEVPPLLFAAMRFLVAGFVLFGIMIARCKPSPALGQWIPALLLPPIYFLIDDCLLFCGDQRVHSGV